MRVDKAFWKSVRGSFGRHFACREGKSVSRLGVCSSEVEALLLPGRKWSSATNLPPGSRLVTPANGASWRLSVGLCSLLGTQ